MKGESEGDRRSERAFIQGQREGRCASCEKRFSGGEEQVAVHKCRGGS